MLGRRECFGWAVSNRMHLYGKSFLTAGAANFFSLTHPELEQQLEQLEQGKPLTGSESNGPQVRNSYGYELR